MCDHHTLSEFGKFLPEKDKEFARSIWTATKDGGGSEKQRYWLGQLAERARHAYEMSAGEESGGPLYNSFPAIVEMFGKATDEGLRRPSFKIDNLKLYLAGPRSKYHGQIMVVDTDTDDWQGRIDETGRMWHSRSCLDRNVTVLLDLEANPAEAAARHGHATGNCCFCARDLTDPRSVTVGYGPICAGKWGLPWGETS